MSSAAHASPLLIMRRDGAMGNRVRAKRLWERCGRREQSVEDQAHFAPAKHVQEKQMRLGPATQAALFSRTF
jgi:hypothetical protein